MPPVSKTIRRKAAGSATVTATVGGVSVAVACMLSAMGGGFSRFVTRGSGATLAQVELPRGVTSAYDVRYNEAAHTLSGHADGYLWPYEPERVGRVRHNIIPAGRRLTVVGASAAARGVSLANHMATVAAAPNQDWEIILPMGAAGKSAAQGDADGRLITPQGTGRLYLTALAPPTENVMPSIASDDDWAIIEFAAATKGIVTEGGGAMPLTMTGIKCVNSGQIQYSFWEMRVSPGGTTLAHHPSRIVLDRVWMDNAMGAGGVQRHLMANCSQLALLEVWLTNVRAGGPQGEVQAFAGWSGSRYHVRRNVMFEGGSIGSLYGGAEPAAPGSGVCDPQDVLSIQCCYSRQQAWVDAGDQSKCGDEAKNVARTFNFNCGTHRHTPTGQPQAMKYECRVDVGELNGPAVRCEDVVIAGHLMVDVFGGVLISGKKNTAVNDTQRIAVLDLGIRNVGKNSDAPCTVFDVQGIGDGLIIDRVTVVKQAGDTGYVQWIKLGAETAMSPSRWHITNNVTPAETDGDGFPGIKVILDSASPSAPHGRGGLAADVSNLTYDGNVLFEPSPPSGAWALTPGATLYASPEAAGVSRTTLAVTGDAANKGVGGGTPGARQSVLDAIAAISWMWSR